MAQPALVSTRPLQRHQSQITRDLLSTLKPICVPDDQHEGQCRQRTHSGMRLQASRRRTLLHFPINRLRQLAGLLGSLSESDLSESDLFLSLSPSDLFPSLSESGLSLFLSQSDLFRSTVSFLSTVPFHPESQRC